MSAIDFAKMMRDAKKAATSAPTQKAVSPSPSTSTSSSGPSTSSSSQPPSYSDESREQDAEVPPRFFEEAALIEAKQQLPPSLSTPLSIAVTGDTTNATFRFGPHKSVFYIPNFITEAEEDFLRANIHHKDLDPRWRQMKGRRLQNWGGTPRRAGLVQEPLPAFLVALGERLYNCGVFHKRPNHGLINEYDGNEGIMAHKDGPLYFPRVAIVSLCGSTMFEFRKELRGDPIFELLIQPRSLLIFQEKAYHDLFHAIPTRFTDTVTEKTLNHSSPGTEFDRTLRTSITLRVVPTVAEESQGQGEGGAKTS